MLTAMLAVENILDDAGHDLWSVNVDDEYHEERATSDTGWSGRAAQSDSMGPPDFAFRATYWYLRKGLLTAGGKSRNDPPVSSVCSPHSPGGGPGGGISTGAWHDKSIQIDP